MRSVHGSDDLLGPTRHVKLLDVPKGLEYHKGAPAFKGINHDSSSDKERSAKKKAQPRQQGRKEEVPPPDDEPPSNNQQPLAVLGWLPSNATAVAISKPSCQPSHAESQSPSIQSANNPYLAPTASVTSNVSSASVTTATRMPPIVMPPSVVDQQDIQGQLLENRTYTLSTGHLSQPVILHIGTETFEVRTNSTAMPQTESGPLRAGGTLVDTPVDTPVHMDALPVGAESTPRTESLRLYFAQQPVQQPVLQPLPAYAAHTPDAAGSYSYNVLSQPEQVPTDPSSANPQYP